MRQETFTIVKSALAADDTVTAKDQAVVLRACRQRQPVEWGTLKDVAAILQCSRRTARRYRDQGHFSAVKLSPRKVRYDLSEVREFARHGATPEGRCADATV
jgi:predicted DNA-binding transcriptional regulator AlpA